MSPSTPLYHYQDETIKISIDAYFDTDRLVIDGYDIGPKVKEYWGDSDYEYILTIPPEGVDFLFKHLQVKPGDRDELLRVLAARFGTNSCYSDIRKLLDDHGVKSEGSSWV